MTTEVTMRELLDNTHKAYLACWRVLAGMKSMDTSESFLQALPQFQYTLANALCDLDRANRDLEQGREEFVRQKAKLPREQFLRDIKRLGTYQEAIGDAARLGKTFGDAFAWFFYQNELPQLYKHLEHEPITEVPTGVGLAGELAFINNVKAIDGHFVLYHGITTILRHGDVSLINLETFKLTCLGELKTSNKGDGEIAITAHFVGPKDSSIPQLFRNVPISNQPSEPLHPKMVERFKRQLTGMAESFKPIPFRERATFEQDTRFPELMKLAEKLAFSEVVYEQCGEGLLLMGVRTDETKTLFDKLLNARFDAAANVQNLGPHVERLIDKSQPTTADNANSIIISCLGRETLPGTTPLLWSPLKPSFLERLFFQDVVVVTVFNPAHLIRKLRQQGFQVHPLGNRRFDIYKIVGENRMSLEGFDYFLRLIQDHLFDEDVVLRILSHAHSIIASGKVGARARMPFYFSQQFQPYAFNESPSDQP